MTMQSRNPRCHKCRNTHLNLNEMTEWWIEAGKADGADTFTYLEIRRDYRRCNSPLCGGYFVSRVNREGLKCADGKTHKKCYVAEMDDSALGLVSDADQEAFRGGIAARAVIVRGEIERAVYGDYGNLGRLVVTEGWHAGTASSAAGIWVKVEQRGVRCVAAPCADKFESKLNSVLTAMISDLDFSPSGATEDEEATARAALSSEDGLIVVGERYTASVDGRTAKARTVTQFYTRLLPTGNGTQE